MVALVGELLINQLAIASTTIAVHFGLNLNRVVADQAVLCLAHGGWTITGKTVDSIVHL